MKTYFVVIPTTDYLVGISDITVEDPLISSVICENNNLEALPISTKYDSFVKSPTGIIEKITRKSSFRIDLTNKIDQGESWQLPLAVAHTLHNNNFLQFSSKIDLVSNSSNSSVIWASGKINSNLEVKPINFLDKKINNSISFFEKCIKKNIPVTIVLSYENKYELEQILPKNNFLIEAIANKKINLIFIKTLYDLFDKINLPNILQLKNTSSIFFLKIKQKIKFVFFIILISLVFYFAYNIWQVTNPLISMKENNSYRVLLTNLSTFRQGNFSQRVGAYFFDYFQNIEFNKLNEQISLNFLPYSITNGLKEDCIKINNSFDIDCMITVEATNVGNSKVFLWMLAYDNIVGLNINKLKLTGKPNIMNGMVSSKETISIDINQSQNQKILFFVYGKEFNSKIRDWLVNLNNRNSLLNSTAKRIKSLGFGYIVKKVNNVKIIENVF